MSTPTKRDHLERGVQVCGPGNGVLDGFLDLAAHLRQQRLRVCGGVSALSTTLLSSAHTVGTGAAAGQCNGSLCGLYCVTRPHGFAADGAIRF